MSLTGRLDQAVQGVGDGAVSRRRGVLVLRPLVERAFERAKVSIDFAGFSRETLHGVFQEPLDKIRVGQLRPESIDLRVLIEDPGQPWAFPCRADIQADEPAFRQIGRRRPGDHSPGDRAYEEQGGD